MKWYKRDPDAALNGMRSLSDEQYKAYNIILDLLYSRDGKVPDDGRFMCSHLNWDPRKWRRVRGELLALGKIHSEGDFLSNSRASYEIPKAQDLMNIGKKLRQIQLEKQRSNASDSARTTTTTTTGGPAPPQAEGGAPLGDCGTSAREAPRSLASALPTGALAPSAARSPEPDKPPPEDIAERRRRVQQELAEMTDAEVTEWCKTRGPNGADHSEKLRSANGGLRHKNGLGG